MTETQVREKAVSQARVWLGCKESDGSHKKIIDTYNSHRPLARGYRLKYTDAWCAGFVSAVAIVCNFTDIMPTEVSCPKLIECYKALGRWEETDSYVPRPGDLVLYDWEDTGSGDNTGSPNHVGMVEKVSGNTVTVIEGNYQNAVKRRSLSVDGLYIRGYCLPDYAAKATEEEAETGIPQLARGTKNDTVKALQILLAGYGFTCGSWGADGEFGNHTEQALKAFQAAHSLEADGVCGKLTWGALLGVSL